MPAQTEAVVSLTRHESSLIRWSVQLPGTARAPGKTYIVTTYPHSATVSIQGPSGRALGRYAAPKLFLALRAAIAPRLWQLRGAFNRVPVGRDEDYEIAVVQWRLCYRTLDAASWPRTPTSDWIPLFGEEIAS